MSMGDPGLAFLAGRSGGVAPLQHDQSGWASGIWGLIAVLVILGLIAILVVSVRRGSSSDDDE